MIICDFGSAIHFAYMQAHYSFVSNIEIKETQSPPLRRWCACPFVCDRDCDVDRRIFKGIFTIEVNCKIFAGSPALSVVYCFRVFLVTYCVLFIYLSCIVNTKHIRISNKNYRKDKNRTQNSCTIAHLN